MTILTYNQSMKQILADLMTDYMAELKSDIPEYIIRSKLSDLIDTQTEKGIIRVCIAYDENTPIAFSVFQIDTPESDWCKRPGWGFIREYYVIPSRRKKSIGRQLADYTLQQLSEMGAQHFYLTSTGAISFWQRCGWTLTDTLCSNGQYILEK